MSSQFIRQAQRCAQLINQARKIVVLTGAGISTNAGIPDFRGPQGLYITKKYDPAKVFDLAYFLADPKPFFDFARDFIMMEEKIQPTFTHRFFARLEESGTVKGILTQNIDALHQRAGSKKVYELHGSFLTAACLGCDRAYRYSEIKEQVLDCDVLHCECGGVIKPNVVFFGENVKFLDEAYRLAEDSDLFLVVGTSCVVYPAASIPSYAAGDIVCVNRDPIQLDVYNVALNVLQDADVFFKEVEGCLGGSK